MDEAEPTQVEPVAVAPKPKRSHHKPAAKAKPSKSPVSPPRAAGPAQTLEQELAASFGKFVDGTAANGLAAGKKVAENFLEGLLEYVHGDKRKGT